MQRNRTALNVALLCTLFALTAIVLVGTLWADCQAGGDGWRQGDWLISNATTSVRRGLSGDALLWLSDRTGADAVGALILGQGALILTVLGAVLWTAIRLGAPDRLTMLLLSPGFVLFWFIAPEASARKEWLVYLAMAFTLVPLVRGRGHVAWSFAALAVYAAAVLAHEALAVFAPALAACLAIVHRSNRRTAALFALAALAAALPGLAYGLAHLAKPDPAMICQPLLDRGLSPDLCNGSIAALSRAPDGALAFALREVASPRILQTLASYIAALLPFYVLCRAAPRPGVAFAVGLAAGLCFLPLYPLGVDWGRWLNFHLAAIVFPLLAYGLASRPVWLATPLPRWQYAGLLALPLLYGIEVRAARAEWGVLVRGAEHLIAALSGN